MMHHWQTRTREDGFTLVELIIALGIGGLLLGVAGAALITGLRTSNEAGDQVSEASWGQIIGNWFLTDVQGAEAIGGENCGAPNGAVIESFSGTTESGVQRHVVWWLTDADGNVHRSECGPGPDSTDVIAQDIIDLRIECEESANEIAPDDALQCTAAWSFRADTPVGQWPYRLTATRRTQ